jgi:hypothetical protein
MHDVGAPALIHWSSGAVVHIPDKHRVLTRTAACQSVAG